MLRLSGSLRLQPVSPLSFSPPVSASLHSSSPAQIPPSAEPLKAHEICARDHSSFTPFRPPPPPPRGHHSTSAISSKPCPLLPLHIPFCDMHKFPLWSSPLSLLLQYPPTDTSTIPPQSSEAPRSGLSDLYVQHSCVLLMYSFPILSICVIPRGILDIFILLPFPHPILLARSCGWRELEFNRLAAVQTVT